jgi:hypothetical protein
MRDREITLKEIRDRVTRFDGAIATTKECRAVFSELDKLADQLLRNQSIIEAGRVWNGKGWHYPIIGMESLYRENKKVLTEYLDLPE